METFEQLHMCLEAAKKNPARRRKTAERPYDDRDPFEAFGFGRWVGGEWVEFATKG